MQKKNFSFHYNFKTKSGKMRIDKKYIKLSPSSRKKACESSGVSVGYGLNLIWEE